MANRREVILLAATGTATSILTESVWALAQESPPVVPDRILVFTTAFGRERLETELFAGGTDSVWERLRRHVEEVTGLPLAGRLRFDTSPGHVRVFAGASGVVSDIRSSEDNTAVANSILKWTAELTSDPERVVYASLAGGRKTMGALLYGAMCFCGRPADRITHVLVNEPFDAVDLEPKFYFPDDPASPRYQYRDPDGRLQVIPADMARVELAYLPLPALREILPDAVDSATSFPDLAEQVKKATTQMAAQQAILEPIDEARYCARTPLIAGLTEDFCAECGPAPPLRGKRVLLLLHCLADLVSFVSGLRKLGLEDGAAVAFIKDYAYPQKQTISMWLVEQGLEVRGVQDMASVIERMEKDAHDARPVLVVEDGGHLTAELLKRPDLARKVVGAIEQTTKGKWRIEDAILQTGVPPPFPLLLVPESRIKKEFEPPHIGRGVVRSIDNLIPEYLMGLPVAILGHGTIGRSVAQHLHDAGARVHFYDKDQPSYETLAGLHYTYAASAAQAVRSKLLVVGTSGKQAIDRKVIEALGTGLPAPANGTRRQVYVASTSSEQEEIHEASLRELTVGTPEDVCHSYFTLDGRTRACIGKRYSLSTGIDMLLLADGFPINFLGFGGMKDRAADFIMSLLFAATWELASNVYRGRQGILCINGHSEIDAIAAKYRLEERFGELTNYGS